jgi:hypothetical protein
MKKLLIGLLALTTISVFADAGIASFELSNVRCKKVVTDKRGSAEFWGFSSADPSLICADVTDHGTVLELNNIHVAGRYAAGTRPTRRARKAICEQFSGTRDVLSYETRFSRMIHYGGGLYGVNDDYEVLSKLVCKKL